MAEITKEEIDEFFKEELALLNDDLEEDLLILESEDDEDKDNESEIELSADNKENADEEAAETEESPPAEKIPSEDIEEAQKTD